MQKERCRIDEGCLGTDSETGFLGVLGEWPNGETQRAYLSGGGYKKHQSGRNCPPRKRVWKKGMWSLWRVSSEHSPENEY